MLSSVVLVPFPQQIVRIKDDTSIKLEYSSN